MASATVDSASDPLQVESIATVDLRLLSQSELYALSLNSDGAFDPRRCDDVVVPKIDRSVFNESAGSRKQTYSRLRLAPRRPESSASTTSTAIPRRTPHLRAPKSATNTTYDTDPERAENSQIIGLLKGLFAAETNGDELVPIRVEYSDSVAQLPNVGNNVNKRKRGRPRKNENLSMVAAEVAEVVPVEVRAEGGDDVIKDIVVYENVENRDKEIVNKNGNAVDLAALATLEDPYCLELQKRTENSKTEEELIGFLRGLNGQWGSRRKKKKIVDASEFGDFLPKGWKLLLSLKKKEGRVWLFVRRYISPNGRQFVSCKEVSSYLLSFFGLQDENQPNCGQSNENIHLNFKMACGNAADLSVKEINKREDVGCSALFVTYVSNDHEKQVTSGVGNSGEIQIGEISKCNKCTMTFNGKDDLLHHQLSSHRRRRSRFGSSITDGVIIKGGQYECQFCHKTFNERNRYNGHVGAHIRHHMKSDEASPEVLTFQSTVNPVSSCGVSPKESMMLTSIGDDYDAVTFNAKADSESKPVSPQSKFKAGSGIESYTDRSSHEVNVLSRDEQDSKSQRNESYFTKEFCVKHNRDYKMNNCLGKLDEANDVVAAKFNFCLDSDVAMSDSDTNSNDKCAANRIKDSSERSLHILSGYEQTGGVKNDVGNVSTRKMEEPKLDETQTYGDNKLTFGISHHRLNTQEKSLEFRRLVLSGNEQTSVEENLTGVCNSTEELPIKKGSFDNGLLTQSCTGKTFGDMYIMSKASTSSMELRPDEAQNSSNSELILSFSNNDTGIVDDVMNNVPIEQTFSFETNLSRENSSIGKDPKQESSLLDPSCYAKTCAEHNLNRVHTGSVWVGPMIDEVVNPGHGKLTLGFGNSNAQSDGDVMPVDMWRLNEENVLQSTLGDTSTQQEQSSSCFPTFSLISDKGENEILGVDGRYDSMPGFEGAQSGRTEHVEFSFLTMQNLNSLPGGSKSLSYNTEKGQGFDSSFWLEKDALSLNLAARNKVTSLCVWCRNEFHHEPVHSGSQTGAVGPMCPTCSAKVSQQFNFF